MTTTLIEYSREVVPMFISLGTKKQIIKEWADEDATVMDYKDQIKGLQDEMKEYIADKEDELTREIKALELDIKLACKGAAKGTEFKAADLKAFFAARAKESVDKVVGKGELFAELNTQLA